MAKAKRDSNSAEDMLSFVDRKRDKPIELKAASKAKPKAAKPKKK